MSNLIFDPREYELRGTLPEVFTDGQRGILNRTINRVQGQLDWNAQLLGFNGPNYWGTRLPTTDNSYLWKGLPDTAFEKRSLQVGSFGIYNKNLPYEERPFPFNRTEIYTSGDQTFSIAEEKGKTIVFPYGLTKDFSYSSSPYVYQGAVYIFDGLVDVLEESDGVVFVTQDREQRITQVELFSENVSTLTVKLENSTAKPFTFFVLPWEDISDWKDPLINSLFLGLWGNKGNELPLHFSFDALNLHGFDEENSLVLDKVKESFSLTKLFEKVGLTPTITTYVNNNFFRFWVEGCLDYFQPEISLETKIKTFQTQDFFDLLTEEGYTLSLDDGSCVSQEFYVFETDGIDGNTGNYDNGDFDTFEEGSLGTINNGLYPFEVPPTDTIVDGGFSYNAPSLITTEDDQIIAQNQFKVDVKPCYSLPDPKFGECIIPNYKVEFFQNFDNTYLTISPDPGPEASVSLGCNGVSGLDFITCGVDNNLYDLFGFPEFILDNGTIESEISPENNLFNGFYDQDPNSLCGNSFDSERNIEGDELVIDVGGEAGPVLYTDIGSDQELVLVGFDPDIGEFELAFDGPRFSSFDITYEALTTLGKVQFPIVEWELDLNLNNGTYFPSNENYPIANADDGIFGTIPGRDEGYTWDEGEFDPALENLIVDQGVLNENSPSCEVDNGLLVYGEVPYLSPNIIDGNNTFSLEKDCVTYDNGTSFESVILGSSTCELNNGEEFESTPSSSVDEGNYNKGLINCEPCGGNDLESENNLTNLRVNLYKEVYSSLAWRMVPSVKNSSSPLRIWKNKSLIAEQNTIADQNNGPEVLGDFNYFVRLPIEYARSEKFWNRAEKICHNFGYFGQSLSNTLVEVPLEPRRPFLYGSDETPADGEILYYEPYLSSSIEGSNFSSQENFADAKITSDQESVGFTSGKITDYNPFIARLPNADGSWRGNYFFSNGETISGHFERDLEQGVIKPLTESQKPIWDTSSLDYPEIFPPELEVGKIIKGHSVSYAYFVSDFSASDEPVFDPQAPYCHRNKTIKGKNLVGFDFGITTEDEKLITSEEVEVQSLEKETRTAYLLHS